MKTLLHVGCGCSNIRNLPLYFQDGTWDEIRYDINEAVAPDIVGTLQDMSIIEDSSVDSIFSSHNIEHVWGFEVSGVLAEFQRVLKPSGFLVVLCPDIQSVAQAITQIPPTEPLYISPAGPISALDILYGLQSDIQAGNEYMAHKTAFTAETLAAALQSSNFSGCLVARDNIFGLHGIATKSLIPEPEVSKLMDSIFPSKEFLLEVFSFGCYALGEHGQSGMNSKTKSLALPTDSFPISQQ